MKKQTAKQKERQADEYRERGRYSKVNPCEVCGKSAGIEYFSNPYLCNGPGNLGLVLCETCAGTDAGDTKSPEEFKRILALKVGGHDE